MLQIREIIKVAAYGCILILNPSYSQISLASVVPPLNLSQAPSNEVLEERINSTRTELVSIVKWALGLTLGLYTVLLGYNFYKSLILDKQEKENLKEELLKSLKESLREELIPETEEKLRIEFKNDIENLEIMLAQLERNLVWTRYKLSDLSANVAASKTAYQYPTAIQEHIQALVLLEEINTPEALDLMHYSLKGVRRLLNKLVGLTEDIETAPVLTEEQIHRVKVAIANLPGEYATSQQELQSLLDKIHPLLRQESYLVREEVMHNPP